MHLPTFRSVLSPYCSTACQTLSLGSTRSFLHLTNVLLKLKYVCFHCSIFLYTFVVFQVERVWHLLSTVCTCKPLVSLWFHWQWNHQDCMASIPMHCPFKCSFTRVCRFTINNNEEWYKVKLKCPSTLVRATKVVITNLQRNKIYTMWLSHAIC